MDLLIRSQDKEALLKIENISIDNENWILGNLISDDNKCICDYWKLGHYETKERALEILDEIQEAQLGNYHYRCPSNVKVSNNENTIVYEMPKE